MNSSSAQSPATLLQGAPWRVVYGKAEWALLQTTCSCSPPLLRGKVFLLVLSWAQWRSRTTQCRAVGHLFTSADSKLRGTKIFVESNVLCLHGHDFIAFCLPQCTEENHNAFKFNYFLYTKKYPSCPIKQRVLLYINPTGKREQPQLWAWLITDPDWYRLQTNCLRKICEVSSFFQAAIGYMKVKFYWERNRDFYLLIQEIRSLNLSLGKTGFSSPRK